MRATESLAMLHSWPLFEAGRRLDLGCAFAWDGSDGSDGSDGAALSADDDARLAARGIGRWRCDLADSRLDWSSGVYDLFGLPRGAAVARSETVSLYDELSRAAMEQLRAYAIRHRRGFTLDARIRPAGGAPRWMRLVAAPVCLGRRVIRLHGFKRDVTDDYR